VLTAVHVAAVRTTAGRSGIERSSVAGLVRDAALVYGARRDAAAGTVVCCAGLVGAQLELIAEVYLDARLCVTAGIETCDDCDRFAGGVCPPHADALARAAAYHGLARQLGAAVGTETSDQDIAAKVG
jgi:hypothetical protein